uniref:Uncharacterized protein n=1 Tax=Arcella intermedia TaxID=1963864 RepID=A0A6B2LN83_9EUKA
MREVAPAVEELVDARLEGEGADGEQGLGVDVLGAVGGVEEVELEDVDLLADVVLGGAFADGAEVGAVGWGWAAGELEEGVLDGRGGDVR